jgi:hypothetical protein
MTAYETARIESRVFGRPVDAETVERLLDHIDNLTEELKASEKLADDRNKALVDLLDVVADVASDLDSFYLGKYIEYETIEKRIEPKRKKLLDAQEVAEKCE